MRLPDDRPAPRRRPAPTKTVRLRAAPSEQRRGARRQTMSTAAAKFSARQRSRDTVRRLIKKITGSVA